MLCILTPVKSDTVKAMNVQLNFREGATQVLDLSSAPLPRPPKGSSIPNPPGFASDAPPSKKGAKSTQPAAKKGPSSEDLDTLKLKKAWEVALAPAKQLPLSAIGLYMSGNSLQIFSIFMVFTLLRSPFAALMNISQTFARFEMPAYRSQLTMVKLAYVATNLLTLALGIYKINAMGLLPTTRSDWLAWESQRMPLERAFPAS
ncbi:MAG: hypothetical protein Q9159_001025 [Coniocarpon cinnabarinum]